MVFVNLEESNYSLCKDINFFPLKLRHIGKCKLGK